MAGEVTASSDLLVGILVGGAWILMFGLFAAMAAALSGASSWFDRWIVWPFIILWVFGGGFLLFGHYGLGWFSWLTTPH